MSEVTTNIGNTASSTKMLRAMVGIGILCALLIVLTYEGTLPRIERLRAEALEKAIFKVLPGTTSTETFYLQEDNTFSTTPGIETEGSKVYAGFNDNNDLVGVAIEGSGQGYADIIKVLYGYNPAEGKVIGFYVLESKETPGLGDKIEKDANFLANFEALDVTLDSNNKIANKIIPVKSGEKNNPWEIDGITGATISSRAIGNIFGNSTEQWVPIINKSKDSFVLSTQGNK